MSILYFAYGSNLSEKRMRDERKIRYYSRKFAILKDYKLVFNKRSKDDPDIGYANIIKSQGAFVEGALYEINDSDIHILDRCEGFPRHYDRITVTLNGNINAIAYIAQPEMINENAKPTKKYIEFLLEGKDLLSESYYEILKEIYNR